MSKVKVYTTNYCPFCHRAKELLKSKGVSFEEIDVTDDDAVRDDLVQKTGQQTVPQIFIDDQSIGGYTELKAWFDAGNVIN